MTEQSAPRQRSVLVVEDELVVAMDLEHSLRHMGYDVLEPASSADEALERAACRRPDLVLMDIRIRGDRDGIEVAELLNARYHVPVVYLSAYADRQTLDRARRTEAFGFLVKPANPRELQSTIELALYKAEMEAKLRERERWLSTTLASIGDAVISTDALARVTFMNSRAELLTGWKHESALGRNIEDVLRLVAEHGDDHFRHPVREALERREVIEQPADVALLNREGEVRLVSDVAAPIFDGERLLGVVITFRDITEERSLRRQLELSERLVSLGGIAAGVASEVDDSLAVIAANTSYTVEELRGTRGTDVERLGDVEDALADVQEAATRLRAAIEDLELFSSPGVVAGTTDVHRMLDWAIRVAAEEISARATVVREFGAVPRVKGPGHRLVPVFVHLLVAAAQSLSHRRIEGSSLLLATRTDHDGSVVVEIRTRQPALPEEVRESVPPARGRTPRPSSLAGSVVSSFGGRLEVEEIQGALSYRVELPGVSAQELRPSQLPDPLRRLGRRRVLVLEDEPMIQKMIRRMLGAEHDVVTTLPSEELLNGLESGDRFDMILCDASLAGPSAAEIYQRLSNSCPEQAARLVLLVGSGSSLRTAALVRSIANPVIWKPFDGEILRATLAELVDRA